MINKLQVILKDVSSKNGIKWADISHLGFKPLNTTASWNYNQSGIFKYEGKKYYYNQSMNNVIVENY